MRRSPLPLDANQRRRTRTGARSAGLSRSGASCGALTTFSAMRPPKLLVQRSELIDERQQGCRQPNPNEFPGDDTGLHQLSARQVDDEEYDGERGSLPEYGSVVARGGRLADESAGLDRFSDGQEARANCAQPLADARHVIEGWSK